MSSSSLLFYVVASCSFTVRCHLSRALGNAFHPRSVVSTCVLTDVFVAATKTYYRKTIAALCFVGISVYPYVILSYVGLAGETSRFVDQSGFSCQAKALVWFA